MRHPEGLLLPIFMFMDYFLTVISAIYKERKYGEHFKTPHYELNPLFQKAISQKQWVNPFHIGSTLLYSGLLIGMTQLEYLSPPLIEFLLGCLFVLFGLVIGRHLSNLFIFGYLIQNPEEISGQISMTHSLVLHLSMYQGLVFMFPMVLLTIFSPTSFVLGGLLGTILHQSIHWKWIRQHKGTLSNNLAVP